jgi:hypothetical protein
MLIVIARRVKLLSFNNKNNATNLPSIVGNVLICHSVGNEAP